VIGWIEDGGNGFLDPTVNNAPAATLCAGTAIRASWGLDGIAGTADDNDDRYDPGRRVITTGPDGIRQTNPQPGSDDAEIIEHVGWGRAYATCLDTDNRNGVDNGNADDQIETPVNEQPGGAAVPPGSDDERTESNEAADPNSDPNDVGYILVLPEHLSADPAPPAPPVNPITFMQVTHPGAPAFGNHVGVNLTVAGGTAADRRDALNTLFAHEGGHGVHIMHNATVSAPAPPGPPPPPNVVQLNPDEGGIMNATVDCWRWPVWPTFNAAELSQIRLHQKPR
jgi:hypothetical protein